jgi:hypothetical protein
LRFHASKTKVAASASMVAEDARRRSFKDVDEATKPTGRGKAELAQM